MTSQQVLDLAQQTAAGVAAYRDASAETAAGESLENPRTSWDRIFEVSPGYAGKSVTSQTALQIIAVWRCVSLIAGKIAKAPFMPYQRIDEGKKRFPEHYLWPILHSMANPYLTAYRYKRMMQAWALLWGNAYAEIEISGRGQVVGLWPWRPDRVRITGSTLADLTYYYRMNDGSEVSRPSAFIFHLRGLETDGIKGLSPILAARQTLGLAMAAEEYGARFFGTGGKPGGLLEHPGKLGPVAKQNLRETFNDLHGGLRGAHRMAILEEGMKYTAVGVEPEAMQFLQTRQFEVIDIARLFGVPPHKVAELSRATFSNIEQQSMEFLDDCLADWKCNWESESTHALLSEREAQSVELVMKMEARGDKLSRYTAYNIGRQGGWLSANMILDEEDMNRVEGGDVLLQPLNMVPVADDPQPGDDPEGEDIDTDDPPGKLIPPPAPAPGPGGITPPAPKKKGKPNA